MVQTPAPRRRRCVSLSEAQTQALLQDVPSVYHTQINDALLTALAETLSSWVGEQRVLVDLEGHGREPLFEEVDLSRTVGWFTSLFPVLLDVGGSTDVGSRLKRIKESLREIPERGLGYGLLRYMSQDEGVRDALRKLPQAQVIFNYHGHLDQVIEDTGIFGISHERAGDISSLSGARSHSLEVLCRISGGRLQIGWQFSANEYDLVTVEQLATKYVECLISLIEHCKSADSGGFTPSDFPGTTISQQDLDRLPVTSSDVYALSPMQAGLLFHTLYSLQAGVYLDQVVCLLEGDFDPCAFEQAWQYLVDRHTVLRTSFHRDGLEEPLQVVHASAGIPIALVDWRGFSEAEQQSKQRKLLEEDRLRGIDLTQAPLMRMMVAQVDADQWRLLWSIHHLVLDRWSLAQLLSEFRIAYEAIYRSLWFRLPPVRPYRDYVGWIKEQDAAGAETH